MKKSLDLLTQIKIGDENEKELIYALLNQLALDMQETETIEVGIEELFTYLMYSGLDINAIVHKLDILSDMTPEEDDKHRFHVLKVMLEGVLVRKS